MVGDKNKKMKKEYLRRCVECLRISELFADAANTQAEMQERFAALVRQQPTYKEWITLSRAAFIVASGDAAAWRQRAFILFLEAKKLGYAGEFNRDKIKNRPPIAAV